jgi:hypothetical protein
MFLAGCTTDSAALNAAASQAASADIVPQAIEAARRLPELPPDCRRREGSGVAIGDRLDVALLKTDRALGRANDRVTRCAAWFEDIDAEGTKP